MSSSKPKDCADRYDASTSMARSKAASSAHVEPVGVVELPAVPVRAAVEQQHLRARRDLDAVGPVRPERPAAVDR